MRGGYCYITLIQETRHKCAFTTTVGKYEYLRMPFGLAQGPSYFIALMQKVVGQLNAFSFFQMGDILVHDSNEQDHLECLKMIFSKIRSRSKTFEMCIFKRHLQYLGHLVSGEGTYPLKEKVALLVNLGPLVDVIETRHSIGLAFYYRKFIASFSDIVNP